MISLLYQSLVWYYFDMIKGILLTWRNFLVFNFNYFSLFVLLRTLFSPWHRYYYSYGKGFSFKKYLNVFTFNAMSRVIGAILRIFIIVVGLLAEVFFFLAGIFVLSFWIILPLILLFLLIFGLRLIIF